MYTFCSHHRCMGYNRGEYSTGQDCRAGNPCASGFGTSSRCGVGDSCLPSRKICFSNSSTSVECKQYTCGMLNSTYHTIDNENYWACYEICMTLFVLKNH